MSALGPMGRIARLGALVLLLAVVSVIPVLNLLVLGLMLNVQGNVVQQRKTELEGALSAATGVARFLVGVFLYLLPLKLLCSLVWDASILRPDVWPPASRALVCGGAVALVTAQLMLATLRGGRVVHFLRPIRTLRWARRADLRACACSLWDSLLEGLRSLTLGARFKVGLVGFVGPLVWLALPALMMSVPGADGPGLIAVLGALALSWVLFWLPFLQLGAVVEGRVGAMFSVRQARQRFRCAPGAWVLSLLLLYGLTLPLYVLEMLLVPIDAVWGMALFFVVLVMPGRLAVAWAYGRSMRAAAPASAVWVFGCRAIGVALMLALAVLLALTPYLLSAGRLALVSNPAILLPAPWPLR